MSVTECAQCQHLCLTPTILNCGHLACRRCLKDEPESYLTCRTCGQRASLGRELGWNVDKLVHSLGTDPVVEQLVLQHLQNMEPQLCIACKESTATMVCHECKKFFCNDCSEAHLRNKAYDDHYIQKLPSKFKVASKPPPGAPKEKQVLQYKADSEEPCQKWWQVFVDSQGKRLRSATVDQNKVVDTLRDLVPLFELLLKMAETEQELLDTYNKCLPSYEVTADPEDNTAYLVHLPGYSEKAQVRPSALEQRLRQLSSKAEPAAVTGVEIVEHLINRLVKGEGLGLKLGAAIRARRFPPRQTAGRATDSTYDSPRLDPRIKQHPSPLKAYLKKVFVTYPALEGDKEPPFISCIICIKTSTLVMADQRNRRVKMMDLAESVKVTFGVSVEEKPQSLAVLSDGLVACTTHRPLIYLLKVQYALAVKHLVVTAKTYSGVAGLPDGNMVVSCERTHSRLASVEIIDRAGQMVRKLVDSQTLVMMRWPDYLWVNRRKVLVSDFNSDCVYRVDTLTGWVDAAIQQHIMDSPRQVCMDKNEHMFVACQKSRNVVMRSRKGRWRELVDHPQFGVEFCRDIYGICLVRSGLQMVMACHKPSSHSVLVGYEFMDKPPTADD